MAKRPNPPLTRGWNEAKAGQSWQEWKDALWEQMANMMGARSHPGLAPLEQYMHRSKVEKRCVECGEPGVVECHSQIVLSVSHYWMCQECSDYWADRAEKENPARRRKKAPPVINLDAGRAYWDEWLDLLAADESKVA